MPAFIDGPFAFSIAASAVMRMSFKALLPAILRTVVTGEDDQGILIEFLCFKEI